MDWIHWIDPNKVIAFIATGLFWKAGKESFAYLKRVRESRRLKKQPEYGHDRFQKNLSESRISLVFNAQGAIALKKNPY
jgi:hypothetical protein